MKIGLKTTIFWNITLLMTAAIILISFVVLRVTEREILKQRTETGEAVFSMIVSSLSHFKDQNTKSSISYSKIQPFITGLVDDKICSRILLVNSRHLVIADTKNKKKGYYIDDIELKHADSNNSLYKKTYQDPDTRESKLVIAGPIYIEDRQAGILKIILPLSQVQKNIAASGKSILIYILFDGAILILFGYFLLSRYLVNPINKIIKLTENISEGNLTQTPLFLSDKNEIGKLSSALNTLSENLKIEKEKINEHFKKLEEKNKELQQAHDEIIQAEKLASVGRLAAGIAHEIGNPIGIILGYIHMLRDKRTDDQIRADYLNRMEKETERVNNIVRNFLDYSRPGKQNIRGIDLNKIIHETSSLFSCQKNFENITVLFNLSDNLPTLTADEKELQQVLINLALNSRDAMPDGGTLTIASRLDSIDKEDRICLIITDTGTGIPEKNQNKIFDPFFTTKAEGKGTGLGLSNVHRIVKSLNGEIELTSFPGKGTTFTIRIPISGR
jgi:two-component system NtrC family sensor kinase